MPFIPNPGQEYTPQIKIALIENNGMTNSPQDSPNVVYIIALRNETFGYDTHLNFLMLGETIFAIML